MMKRWALRHKLGAIALIVICGLYIAGILAPLIAPYDYLAQDLTKVSQGPSFSHWFGTDRLGRDLFSRVLFSLRTTAGITTLTLLFSGGIIGITLGLIAGYKRGRTDDLIMGLGNLSAGFPALLFMILIGAALRFRYDSFISSIVGSDFFHFISRLPVVIGLVIFLAGVAVFLWRSKKSAGAPIWICAAAWFLLAASLALLLFVFFLTTPGFSDLILISAALLPFSWYGTAMVIRSQVLILREQDFILAAKAMGASDWRIVFVHLLPNVLGLVVVGMSAGLAAVAASEVGLTWLGLGVQPPHPSFGRLIAEAGSIRTLQAEPHLLLFPAGVVAMLFFAFNLLGDALGSLVTTKRG
ncbi:MAG: hypothetical protein A3A32_01370 [Candidatus Wildermuthbacteria bacterium RIFCSPLOWO2_01_FULL_48_35]|uniref:Oligopeptide transport system permease protein OppC n=2 Tax=Candidatus Wildermuthiibacteriota TaxID=1817923 RepID=A0A1G2RLM1_9BACT|nr:MAG: Binding-protein-dependent transport system inner membrane component [Parcubacteria group bacterium GW2011_GWA2_47_9]OHA73753.1 MAG: hypothetical protein A3A32_01370 [Candidatus Wildermuthbacteria bacterium RIFCSPLOWO2_01_FULL_48_35]